MTQPEALRLADAIDPRNESEPYWRDREDAAAELRRLYEENKYLRTALEQPEQEPVAHQDTADKCLLETVPAKGTLFHTAPLQRKPLTDDDIQALWEKAFDSGSSPNTFARAIEAAHGIKESI